MVKKWKFLFVVTLLFATLNTSNASSLRRKEIDLNKVVSSIAMLHLDIPDLLMSDLLVDCLTGSNPFILQTFGQLIMSVLDVGNLINAGGPSVASLNNAFNALNLGFDSLKKLFTDLVPLTFELFTNLSLSIVGLIAKLLRSITSDIFSFLKIVELLSLNPTDLLNLLLLGSEQSLFSFISKGAFNKSALLAIADLLNIDLSFSGVLSFFGIFNFGFVQKFASFVTNDLFKLLDVLGIAVDVLKAALKQLNVLSQILNLDFIKSILGVVTSQQLLANIISPTVAVTKKGNALLDLFMNLSQYTQLSAIPLIGGGSFPISFQDFGNFTKLLSLTPLTDLAFGLTSKIGLKDLSSCVITEITNGNVLGLVTSTKLVNGLFEVPNQGVSQLVEGTPLVCVDFLMGILESVDNLVLRFRPLQPISVIKSYDFRNPFFDFLTRMLTFGRYSFWLVWVNVYLLCKDYPTELSNNQ